MHGVEYNGGGCAWGSDRIRDGMHGIEEGEDVHGLG